MKRTIEELIASTYHEELGVEVIDTSLLLGLEWGEVKRLRKALESVEKQVVLTPEEEDAIRTVMNLLHRLE